MNESEHSSKKTNETLDKILHVGVLALVALLPLFVLPLSGLSVQVGKILLVEFGVLFLFLVWIWKQFRNRSIKTTRSILGGALAGFSLLVIGASLLSQDPGLSFFGESFTTSEGLFWACLGLLGFLSAQIFNNYKRIVTLYAALVVPFLGVALVQLLRFVFGGGFLGFGVLQNDIATLVGGWNELGMYAGFILLVTLVGVEFLKLKSLYRTLLYVVFGAALFLLFLTNVSLAWVAVTVGAFLVFLYKTAFRKESEMDHDRHWRLPVMSLVVFILALMSSVFLGDATQSLLSKVRNIQYNEIRLSPEATLGTAGSAWKRNVVTGVGPNYFGYLWQQSRDDLVSRQSLSDVQFAYGYSTIFTLLATLGILGALVLVFIVGRLIQNGVQIMSTAHTNRLQRFFALSVFVLTLYLWLLLFLYVPGPVMLAYSFVMLGTFAGLSADARRSKPLVFSLHGEKSFAAAVVVIFVLAVGIGASFYQSTQKAAGMFAFRRSLYAVNVQSGYEDALLAARLGKSSVYYRSLAGLLGQQIAVLDSQSDIMEDEDRSQLEFFLGQALTFSLEGVSANPYDYRNWLALGDTYAVLNSYEVEGAYVDARTAYERALSRNPKANDVLARLTSLEIDRGNTEEAQGYVDVMVERRPGDVQALVLGARIAYEGGESEEGDRYLDAAVNASLEDANVLMQLGVFAFNNNRFAVAERIFDYTTVRFPGFKEPAVGLLYSLERQEKEEESRQVIVNLIDAGILTEEEISNLELDTGFDLLLNNPEDVIAAGANEEIVTPESLSEEGVTIGSAIDSTEE